MTDRTIRNAATLRGWRRSSHSNDQGGSCLEVVDARPGVIAVRDSKIPAGPALLLSASGWTSFITSLKEDVAPSRA
ncbi:DUF397 domain-containing protein [Streptomyces rochei]|uniref:DUF397 domain-containing protein n=1 Tax=Streptomyces rochei TaxID=1928 RepID=UPI00364272E0